MRLLLLCSVSAFSLVSNLPAQCTGGDIAAYWDNSVDSSSGIADFWSVTDGDGCSDSCGGGTTEYVVRSTIADSSAGITYADGGTQSDTAAMTSPGMARSDAAQYVINLPSNTPLTFTGVGYSYQCSCNQCTKIATFLFDVTIRLATSYFGPLRSSQGGFCSYSSNACSSGTPTCSAP